MKRDTWLSRNALGLWFLGLAALGFLRWWLKIGRDAATTQPTDAMLWLAGSIAMAMIGLVALWRSR